MQQIFGNDIDRELNEVAVTIDYGNKLHLIDIRPD